VHFNGLSTVQYRQVWVDDTLTIARSEIDRFEVGGGSKRQTAHGALLGLTIGAGAGLIVGLASYKGCEPRDSFACMLEPATAAASGLQGAAVGGALGAVVGALFGAMSRTEKWVTVTPHGAGLSVSF
jgi:hypothetical protein